MHISVLEFFLENLQDDEIAGKRVLEVGSKYVNGSVRPLVQRCRPKQYVGIDVKPGKFVDVVLPAEKLLEFFGEESFDAVISTETIEHVRDWRLVISNIKNVVIPGGCIYITTRSIGFPYHGYPNDFWRYELEDMQEIFSDFDIVTLQKDHEVPGVFLKAAKRNKAYADLSRIALCSMVLGRRTSAILELADMPFSRRIRLLGNRLAIRSMKYVCARPWDFFVGSSED